MSPLDGLLEPGAFDALVLVAMRIGGMMLLAPTFSSKQVPMRFRTAILVVLTILLWPVARHAEVAAVAVTPGTALVETMLGMVIGLGVGMAVWAAEMAGDLIAMQTGLSGASSLDPVTFQSSPTVGTFFRLVAVTLLLSLDMHLVIIDGLAASFRAAPLGAPMDWAAGAQAMVLSGATLFTTGLRMAAPVMAAILTLNIALGMLARAAPQLQLLSISYALQIGVGLFVLAGSLPFVAAALLGWQGGFDHLVGRLLDAFHPVAAGTR